MADLAYNEAEIPRTHNIEQLFSERIKYDASLRMDAKISNKLTDYATISRYPDSITMWSEADARLAMHYAKQTLDMVKQALIRAED